MALPELLQRLLAAPGPSGHETRAAAVWREAAGDFADVTTDALGSVVARVPGRGDGPTVALVGHIDQIGFLVTHVDDRGLLALAFVGGVTPEVAVGQRVVVLGRGGDVPGVVARAAGSLEQRRERGQADVSELHVDIGAQSREEARRIVRPGDPGVLVGPPVELENGRFAAAGLDNRLGAYVVLESARRVAAAGGAPGDLLAVASTQEETLHAGARVAAFALEPEVAIAVDITPASDVPGGDPRRAGEVNIGGGPAIDRAPLLNHALIALIEDTAEREGIALQYEVNTTRTHTDADDIHASRTGVPSALVSVPLRYMHTPVETAQLSDVEETVRLLAAVLLRLDRGVSLAR